jgi:hypothetical protein
MTVVASVRGVNCADAGAASRKAVPIRPYKRIADLVRIRVVFSGNGQACWEGVPSIARPARRYNP